MYVHALIMQYLVVCVEGQATMVLHMIPLCMPSPAQCNMQLNCAVEYFCPMQWGLLVYSIKFVVRAFPWGTPMITVGGRARVQGPMTFRALGTDPMDWMVSTPQVMP